MSKNQDKCRVVRTVENVTKLSSHPNKKQNEELISQLLTLRCTYSTCRPIFSFFDEIKTRGGEIASAPNRLCEAMSSRSPPMLLNSSCCCPWFVLSFLYAVNNACVGETRVGAVMFPGKKKRQIPICSSVRWRPYAPKRKVEKTPCP